MSGLQLYLMAVRITLLLSENPSFINWTTIFNDLKLHVENSHPIHVFGVKVISLIMVIKMTATMVVDFTVLKVLFLQKNHLNNQLLSDPGIPGAIMFLYRFVRRCRQPQILVHVITFEQLFKFLSFFARLLVLTNRLPN